jgi:hypothetical protein
VTNSTKTDNLYTKATHNTKALEEALISSIQTASLPTKQAIANMQFLRAKALLIRVCTYLFGALAITIILLILLYFAQLIFSSWGSGRPDTIIAKNDIKNNETISQKEIELREIINNNLNKSEDITSKSTRKITSKNTSVNEIIKANSRIGQLVKNLPPNKSKTEVVEVDNMIVGPEVQTLTVFNKKEIKLKSQESVFLVAGHQFDNNSSTSKWRQGYCYTTILQNNLSVRIELATKSGKDADAMDAYITDNETKMLGGNFEVDKLRGLCPWLN